MSEDAAERRRSLWLVGAGLVVSILASIGLIVTYLLGGQNQVEGALLFLALGGIGWSLVAAAHRLLPQGQSSEPRPPLPSEEADRARVAEEAGDVRLEPSERRWFLRLLVGALGALGLAAVLPALSLGPRPGRTLFSTSWRTGSRVVTEDGTPLRVDDLRQGGIVTVFPEGHTDEEDAQTVLLRLDPEQIIPVAGREDWMPEGNVAYSKVCTHAGCPVGLFDVENNVLFCPCHQSTFDVLEGAKRVFGPAPRALPQLPLDVDPDGFLVARADYDEPIGPSFWDRTR